MIYAEASVTADRTAIEVVTTQDGSTYQSEIQSFDDPRAVETWTYSAGNLSPDGRSVAVVLTSTDSESTRIVLEDVVTGAEQLIAAEVHFCHCGSSEDPRPKWSPSGRYLSYMSGEAGSDYFDTVRTFIFDTVTGQTQEINGHYFRDSWSSEEDILVFHDKSMETIDLYDPRTSKETTLANGAWWPQFVSPEIVAVAAPPEHVTETVLLDIRTRQEVARLPLSIPASYTGDSKYLDARYFDENLAAASMSIESACHLIVVFDDTTTCYEADGGVAWNPVAPTLAFIRTDDPDRRGGAAHGQLVLMDARTGAEREIALLGSELGVCSGLQPQWSADGAYLLVTEQYACSI